MSPALRPATISTDVSFSMPVFTSTPDVFAVRAPGSGTRTCLTPSLLAHRAGRDQQGLLLAFDDEADVGRHLGPVIGGDLVELDLDRVLDDVGDVLAFVEDVEDLAHGPSCPGRSRG